jgi:hypothetical protein
MVPTFLEYLTANEQIAYPFKEGAPALVSNWADVVVAGNATIAKDVLLDAVLLVPAALVGELYLRRITCTAANNFDLLVADGAGVTVLTVAVDITSPPAPRSVIQEVVAGPPPLAIRLLTGEHFVAYLLKIQSDLGVGNSAQFGVRLPFETAAVEFRPNRVDKLTFKDYLGTTHDLLGDVGVYEGYNVELAADANGVLLTAAPGLGLGRDDSACVGPPLPPWAQYLVNLSGTLPDEDGNVNIDSGNCYRVEPDPVNHRLLVYNDCQVCCTCDDYANYAKTFDNLLQRLATVWKGPFFPDPDYANLHKMAQTLNSHIGEYNGTIFPKIRTVAAWAHVMVGINHPASGRPAANADRYATVSIVVVNRVSSPVTITGAIDFTPDTLVEAGNSGKDEGKAQTGTITVTGTLVNWNVTLQPFTEEHLYVLVRSALNNSLAGLAGSMTYTWTQYGVPKSVTVPVT